MERAFNEINNENKSHRSIAKSFAQCGIDPSGDDIVKFTKHLDSLGEQGMYKALTEQHTAEILELKVKRQAVDYTVICSTFPFFICMLKRFNVCY